MTRAGVTGTQAQELGKTLNHHNPVFLLTIVMLSFLLSDLIFSLCRPKVAEQLKGYGWKICPIWEIKILVSPSNIIWEGKRGSSGGISGGPPERTTLA